jgi:uncharacterized protein YcfL
MNTADDMPPVPKTPSGQRIVTDWTQVSYLDVVDIREATVSGDILKVQATVRNAMNREKTFAYRFGWVDENGMEVRSPGGGWRPMTLGVGEKRAISGVANSPKAVDFRLQFEER